VKVIFIVNGFTAIAAFDGLVLGPSECEELVGTIKNISDSSPFHPIIKNMTYKDPKDFQLTLGFKRQLISVCKVLSTKCASDFVEKSNGNDNNSGNNQSKARKRSICDVGGTSNKSGESSKRTKHGDDNECELILKRKLNEVFSFIQPTIGDIDLQLELVDRTESKVSFEHKCFFCSTSLRIFTINGRSTISPQVSAVTKHLKLKHPDLAGNLVSPIFIIKTFDILSLKNIKW
jgi:hypothetical protein